MTYGIVILSTVALYPTPQSAGERLVRELYTALDSQGKNPLIMAPRSPYSRDYDSQVNQHLVEVERGTPGYCALGQLLDAWTPDLQFLRALREDSVALELLRGARIIDLQWAGNFLLSYWIRKINPGARLIGTYHDISYQRLARRSTYEPRKSKALLWRSAARASRLLESALTRELDTRVVLSHKDQSFLPRRQMEQSTVLLPPIEAVTPENPASDGAPIILFVGAMYRWENDEAICWFIRESLPLIWQEHPQAILQVIGVEPSAQLLERAQGDPRIIVTGFLDDIESYYVGATVVISPIRLGSGVKFKTLDAILHGVPVVATIAGTEGVANVQWVSVLAHSACDFARGVSQVLGNQEHYRRKAKDALNEAKKVYSRDAYRMRVAAVYK